MDFLEYVLKNGKKVPEFDDLGNPLRSIDDLGGSCKLGEEYVHKDHLYTCMKCGENFCRKHVRFVDNDQEKPLCNHGLLRLEGCYTWHAKKYATGIDSNEIERLKALIKLKKVEKELEALKK